MDEVVLEYHLKFFEKAEEVSEFEELDTYIRMYGIKHISKSSCIKVFNKMENLFSIKNLYKQILYHRSFQRFRMKMGDIIASKTIDKDD
jgi:hypothetical protein